MFAAHVHQPELNVVAQLLTTAIPASEAEIAEVEAKLTEIERQGYAFCRMTAFAVGKIARDEWFIPHVTMVFLKTDEPVVGQLHLRMEEDHRIPASAVEVACAEINNGTPEPTVIVMYRS